MARALLALIWIEPLLALTLTTLQHFRQLKTQKLYMHVDGRPKKVRTVSRGELCLMYETSLSRMIMQLPPVQMANQDGDAGMETMLWEFNIIPNDLAMDTSCFLREFYIGVRWAASDVSPSSHLAFHIPTLAGFCLLFVLGSCLVLLLWCVFVSCFASVLESRILRAV